jgi:hypothetical protein
VRLINIGCSFSYGNCIAKHEEFAQEHVSPGTLIAQHLNCEEVNIASPGLSLDGLLRRLYTFEFEEKDVFLIGLPPNLRVQYVCKSPRNQYKIRGDLSASEYRNDAFNRGPKIAEDWFKTMRWDTDVNIAKLDLLDTTTYWSYLNILLIQQAIKTVMNDKLPVGRILSKKRRYWMYNSVHGHMQQDTDKIEIQALRKQIDMRYYYMPEVGLADLIDNQSKYTVARDDTHPNHVFYHKWANDFIAWMETCDQDY